MGEILVGPAGWTYEDWAGRVYPDPLPEGFDALQFIARHFPVVELNNTFYRPPVPKMSEGWARKTPERFLFTAKVWQKLTHDAEGFSAADARLYQEGIAPLLRSGRLAALLLQYPWFFKDGPEERDRIRRAVEALGGWAPLVVEVRHRSWLDAIDFLKELKLSFCNIDQPKSSTAITGTDLVTGPVAYVRLHGRNAKAWFSKEAGRDQKYDYLYSLGELRPWAEAVKKMQADRTFVIFNNHFQGKGVLNALQFMRLLGLTMAPDAP